MKLLIVEDNAQMRAIIRHMVAGPGDEVHECADGAAALDAYCEFKPEWVTMDIGLSGMDGLSATRQIKGRFPRARIVIVTQFDDESFRAAARKAGAQAYVLKENLSQIRQLFSQPNPPVTPPPGGETFACLVRPVWHWLISTMIRAVAKVRLVLPGVACAFIVQLSKVLVAAMDAKL